MIPVDHTTAFIFAAVGLCLILSIGVKWNSRNLFTFCLRLLLLIVTVWGVIELSIHFAGG